MIFHLFWVVSILCWCFHKTHTKTKAKCSESHCFFFPLCIASFWCVANVQTFQHHVRHVFNTRRYLKYLFILSVVHYLHVWNTHKVWTAWKTQSLARARAHTHTFQVAWTGVAVEHSRIQWPHWLCRWQCSI